jgi:hypothetical protein
LEHYYIQYLLHYPRNLVQEERINLKFCLFTYIKLIKLKFYETAFTRSISIFN